jgi:phospholipid/cholesterol/gamma-HCH transport system substrate-binding protein
MSILTSVKLPTDTIASVRTSGLIGDKFIALAPGADEDSLQASEQILMTESAVELESLISKMAFGGVSEESDAAEEEKSQ